MKSCIWSGSKYFFINSCILILTSNYDFINLKQSQKYFTESNKAQLKECSNVVLYRNKIG